MYGNVELLVHVRGKWRPVKTMYVLLNEGAWREVQKADKKHGYRTRLQTEHFGPSTRLMNTYTTDAYHHKVKYQRVFELFGDGEQAGLIVPFDDYRKFPQHPDKLTTKGLRKAVEEV